MSSSMDAAKRRYEMMFIIQPGATENARKKVLDEIRGYIAETGGKIFHEDDWGLRDLAYTIKRHDTGYYYIFYFEGVNTEMLKDLDQDMRLNPDVVRHMTLTLPKEWELIKYDLADEVEEMLQEKPKSTHKARKTVETKQDEPTEEVDEKQLDEKLDAIMKDDDLGL